MSTPHELRVSARPKRVPIRYGDYVCPTLNQASKKSTTEQEVIESATFGNRTTEIQRADRDEKVEGATALLDSDQQTQSTVTGDADREGATATIKSETQSQVKTELTRLEWSIEEREGLVKEMYAYLNTIDRLLQNRGSRTRMKRLLKRLFHIYDELYETTCQIVERSRNEQEIRHFVRQTRDLRKLLQDKEDTVDDHIEARDDELSETDNLSLHSKCPSIKKKAKEITTVSADRQDEDDLSSEISMESHESHRSLKSQEAVIKAKVAELQVAQEQRQYELEKKIREAQHQLLMNKTRDIAARAKLEASLWNECPTSGDVEQPTMNTSFGPRPLEHTEPDYGPQDKGLARSSIPVVKRLPSERDNKEISRQPPPMESRILKHGESEGETIPRLSSPTPFPVKRPQIPSQDPQEWETDDEGLPEDRSPLDRIVDSIKKSDGVNSGIKFSPRPTPTKSREENLKESKAIQQFFQGMSKPQLPKFDGNKTQYEDWRAQFQVFVDDADVPFRFKMISLKNALVGKAAKLVTNLGYTENQYRMALFKLEQRYGGENRRIQQQIDSVLAMPEVSENDLRGLESMANRLCDLVSKLEDLELSQELHGQTTLYTLVKKKIPCSLLVDYEKQRGKRSDGLAFFTLWFNQQVCLLLETSETKDPQKDKKGKKDDQPKGKRQKAYTSTGVTCDEKRKDEKSSAIHLECLMCKLSHHLTKCDKWKKATVDQRWKIAKEKGLCYRCLTPDHHGKDCKREPRKCDIDGCERTHHRHLHAKKPEPLQSAFGVSKGGKVLPMKVALRTIPVVVKGHDGQERQVTALLDDGSDSTYVSRTIATALGLPMEKNQLSLSTITGRKKELNSGLVVINIGSLDGKLYHRIGARVLDKLCENLRPQNWQRLREKWPHLRDIPFPKIDGSQGVDILIGADHPELTLALEERSGKPGAPIARLTPLGWTCIGTVEVYPQLSPHSLTSMTYHSLADSLKDESLRALWEMDIVYPAEQEYFNPEEQKVLAQTNDSMKYLGDRYEVGIPWIADRPDLPNNFEEARRRLISLEHTLRKKPQLAQKYQERMQQSIEKGYLQKSSNEGTGWYLPHFPVVREDKETTKVRIVYDSATRCKGVSLNDTMNAGPKLQQDIVDILIRFREGQVALIGDIKEMFSQVLLKPSDRTYHRILWRDLDPARPITVYESTRLTFGDKASPFLAQHVLQSHAKKFEDQYPEAAKICTKKIYIDDVLFSVDFSNEAINLRRKVSTMLGTAGFQIRRWCSNDVNVLRDISPEDRATGIVEVQNSTLPSVKTLGVLWNASTDRFGFATQNIDPPTAYTKRSLLSRVATLFDPLQFLAPFTIRVKTALQQAWVCGLDWDEPLPSELRQTAEEWFVELQDINEVSLPRCYFKSAQEGRDVSLHTFSDASSTAYAAVTYIRSVSNEGTEVAMVAAKSRVTPLRAISIPRLELMAAVLGYRLTRKITALLQYTMTKNTFWTDSMDVVHWVRSQSKTFKPFVANRIAELQSQTLPHQWRHVPGTQNPADVATRGMTASELAAPNMWFQGPPFLCEDEIQWPQTKMDTQPSDESIIEKKQVAKTHTSTACSTGEKPELLEALNYSKFSTWIRLVRVTAWVFRFVEHLKDRTKQKSTKMKSDKILTIEEFQAAEKRIVREAQCSSFRETIKLLETQKGDSKSNLKNLTPFLDEENILRVGGRLQKSTLPYDTQHQMILPASHHVTELIVRQAHSVAGHSRGVNAVLAEIRLRFWIVNGREVVKKSAYRCYHCRRKKNKPASQIMAPLPSIRLSSLKAFTFCGIDFAGPFISKITRRVTAKRYICLFTCTSTRAVHLEMACSLDTEGFLQAFSRMVARRGKPENVVTDNGTNFVGAERQLRELIESLDQDYIVNTAANHGIRWRFNPPYGSHHGGVFEALIKSAKKSLYAILGERSLTDEELHTAIVEVEGLLNSRPLTYCSSDPQDEHVLTPNHFLQGQCGGPLAPLVVDEIQFNLRNRWRFVQDLVSQFWKRWNREYLLALQQKGKWLDEVADLAVNDVVVMYEQGTPRGCWPIGKILEIYPSSDGHVRTVQVQSRGKEYIRPITRLVPLVKCETEV